MAHLEVSGVDDGVKTLINESETGNEIVKVSGDFGGATVSLGYLDYNGTFVGYTKCDGLPAEYTVGFETSVSCGLREDLSFNITGSTGSTEILLSVRSI